MGISFGTCSKACCQAGHYREVLLADPLWEAAEMFVAVGNVH